MHSDFVAAVGFAHKKCRLTYQTYAASIFFVRALSRLELEINQSFHNYSVKIRNAQTLWFHRQ